MKRFRMKAYLLLTLLLAAYILPGCGGDAGNGHWDKPTVIPTVSSTVPTNNATGVAIGSSLTATFSEEMNSTTITDTTFTLMQGVTAIAGTVTYSGVTAVFAPTNPLTSNTLYTATITSGATDLDGNTLATNYVWSFTTGLMVDSIAPLVTSTVPLDQSTDVATNSSVTATFSEAMAPATISTATFSVKETVLGTVVAGNVNSVGTTATLTPTNLLKDNTEYTATVTTGAQDLAGNALAVAKVWTFTTSAVLDIISPLVTSTVPLDLAIDVATDSSVTATFNEAMNTATISTATFSVKETVLGTVVAGNVNLVDTTATFTPANLLKADTEYTATVTTGAQDLAGNALAADEVWTFTTAAPLAIIPGAVCSEDSGPTIPTVTMSDPTDGNQFATTSSSGVVGNGKVITATFDMAMDPTTINPTTFTLAPEGGVALIPASVTYDALTNVATLTTSSALLEDTVYEVMITTDVTSAATPGVPLACPYLWTFKTTTPAATGQMPVPLGSASNFVILASAAITNIPTSAITGDVGLTPDSGSNISGFDQPLTCPEVTGTIYAVDAAGPACAMIDPVLLQNAKNDAEIAFLNARAAVRGTPAAISGDLNGLTFAPGLYESLTSLEISPGGFLYLDAQGDVNAVFIIRSETTITTQSTSQVILTGGAKANNVYWTAGSSVTLGTNSIMKGTMIAGTSISLLTGANLEGRALNQGAAAESITLDQATITLPLP